MRDKTARPMQLSLGVMLLMMLIFAFFSAGFFYAAKIPEVQQELAVLTGRPVDVDRSRRGPQIAFILFTFTSPLLLAMIVSVAGQVMRRVDGRPSV